MLLVLLAVSPAFAVNRVLTIAAPVLAEPVSKISVVLFASTNAGGGEQIGFFHAEYSIDDGKTWIGITYSENVGAFATRTARFTTGAAGSKVYVRVRLAFRGGPAGNVDYQGGTINWAESWAHWQEPPAKVAITTIVTP